MLDIKTFDARAGGNVLYKALSHPLAAEKLQALAGRLRDAGEVGIYDPDNVAAALFALHPAMPAPTELYVHDVEQVGVVRDGIAARPLTDLPRSGARTLLIAAFDAARTVARVRPLLAPGMDVVSLDEARLPAALTTVPGRVLDKLNYATNFVFFRDEPGLHTRLVTANYWSGYGSTGVRFWLRLYGSDGRVLAEWEEGSAAGGIVIDSQEVRGRFGLRDFAGQLFLHAVGIAGHDVVKYALDTYADEDGRSLSCTHDANAWPSERYAGLPAPRPDERVVLWLQNSHAAAIPAGAVALDRMGAEAPVPFPHEVAPYASVAIDVAELLPDVRWPAQVELRAGRHVVRPRYEVVRGGRTRIAHMNVERADLRPDPGIKALSNLLGRGFLLPFPILPRAEYRSVALPTPMAEHQTNLPLRIDVFGVDGRLAGQRFLGCLPRDHDVSVDLDEFDVPLGHAELVYDFRDGGDADGWMHTLARYEHRKSGHAAETSFGAHIYNTAMTYRDEPQSYSGPPPGLTTRLFLKLGFGRRRSFAHLIYPASAAWHPHSTTFLELYGSDGERIAAVPISIACSGSALVFPDEAFGPALLAQAGPRGYVLVRDATCRLFGYHGLTDGQGAFSLDHMFGF